MKFGKRAIARLLVGSVVFFNLQCALLFLFQPEAFQSGFELEGLPGRMIVQALGLLFGMWNIPYLVALVDPVRQRVSLLEAVAMQATGLVGETWLVLGLAPGHSVLQSTAIRFICFDAGGLIALLAAWEVARKARPS